MNRFVLLRVRHGLRERQGRQVALDDNCQVLYSTADTAKFRTGVSSGVGYPELCLDDDHADILVGFVGASMRKLRKTSTDRDMVSADLVRVKSFCDAMLQAVMVRYGQSSTDTLIEASSGGM